MAEAWISRVAGTLEPSHQARGSDPLYLTHQMVADLFGDRAGRGYLYRSNESPVRPEALVISRAQPQEPQGCRHWGRLDRLESKPFSPELAPGQRLDFEVRLNATRTVTEDGRKRRRDVWDATWAADPMTGATPADTYGAYLRRVLEGAAAVDSTAVTERGGRSPRRASSSGSGRIFFVAANMVGSLTVVDPVMLLNRVVRGVGRSRAFGCGLMCLSRPGTVLPHRYPGLDFAD